MTLQISISHLSLGMRGDDVARVQQALQALGRDVPRGEKTSRVMGAGTAALLKALQTDLALPATGVVDAETVKAINLKLASRETDQRVVRGSVRDANGQPFSKGIVQIFGQGAERESTLGKSRLSADGSYEISYRPPSESSGRVDLRVAVLDDSGPIETTPSGASVLANAGSLEVVNFALSGEKNPPLSEFEVILNDLKPLLGTRNLVDLKEEENRREISLLAIRSGYSPEQVAALVVALKLEKQTRTPAPVFYGLFRQGMPYDVTALHSVSPDLRLKALKVSTEQGIIPPKVRGKKVEDYLAGFVPSPTRELRGLLGRVLNTNELKSFVEQYLKDGQDPKVFWKRIETDSAFANRAAELKLTVQLGALTNNHVPLVGAIRARPDVTQASDLARLTEDDWKSLIQAQSVGVPAETPGAKAEEKVQNYVGKIIGQVEAAFPTRFLAERLDASPVATFLKSQPSLDLKTTYLEQFFKKNPNAAQELAPQDRDQLRSLQRLHHLTSSANETIALSQKGVGSAYQIARTDPKVFAEQHQEILSAERAKELHERARRTNAIALALLGEHGAGLNRTGLHALPKLDVAAQKQEALVAENGIPNWETLFGPFDSCACQECSSVHGAAAYLADILMFLGEREAGGGRRVREVLFDRRPDLGEIELSCENTNTVLPLIDLVNEVLENAVAPPAPFALLTLEPAREEELNQALATPELAAAFDPPLKPVARVETLEAGKRWRIWDEPFAYSVIKDNDVVSVVTRSRQTTGPTEERRATPQYRNGAAYDKLGQAVYPWKLPFELPAEEANVFLKHLGVSRRGLIEAFRPRPGPLDPNIAFSLAAEGLGLTEMERKIIVDETLDPPRQPGHFWSGTPVAPEAAIEDLKKVRVFLDRSGLTYAELELLVASWFINPGGNIRIESVHPDDPATCDTHKLLITNLDAAVLSRMHRFVRLWRKLGWTVTELDKALRAFAPGSPATPSLTNEILVKLDHLSALRAGLRISVAQALTFWKPIDTREPASLYRGLFNNPALFKPQEEDFRLGPDGQELIHSAKLLADADHAAALKAVFRLNSADFDLLVAKTDGTLKLENLSLLYRHAIMARQFRLSVPDLLTARDLTGIDPFQVGQTQETLRFVETVKAVRSSGFNFAELDYLIRHRFNPASSFVPTESSLAQTLTDVRADLLQVVAESGAERKKLRERSDKLLFRPSDLEDLTNLAVRLRADTDPLSQHLRTKFGADTQQLLQEFDGSSSPSESLQRTLIDELNRVMSDASLFEEQLFAHVTLTPETEKLTHQTLVDDDLIRLNQLLRLNRLLLDEAYPRETAKSHSLIIDRVSAALSLPADVTGSLLRRVFHAGKAALQRFIELSAIDPGLPPSLENSRPQFETLEKLLKIASVLQTLKLPGSQLDWLFQEHEWLAVADNPAATPVAFASWFSLIQLQQLRQDLTLEDAALEAILDASSALAQAADEPSQLAAKETFVTQLSRWLGWPREDLETLVGKPNDLDDLGLLKALLPADYRGLSLLVRLQRVMSLLKQLGVTPIRARAWCEAAVSDSNAKEIRRAAKAKYEDDAWLKLVTPLQDAFRDKQREALVAYLAARPEEWKPGLEAADANDLYSHFLIDVEMTSCQLTSRIKQAHGSVQLFVQRCLMGLETNVKTSESKWSEWEWMKNFRVWEANRKIWLYPENWIEPELRDDKTPFFKELESELLQTDLDDAAAEQALLRYLEKLDEVANFEIAGIYEDDASDVLHVFGRTLHNPRRYYYRRGEGTPRSWTPWEKVEVDIEGDHLIPVVWNRKLMLIWPIFTEKETKKAVEMPDPGNTLDSGDAYWEIQLAWSEYENGRWTGKNLSEAVILTAYQAETTVSFGNPPGFERTEFVTVTDHRVSPPVTYIAPRRLVSKERILFKAIVVDETLMVHGFLRRDYYEYRPGTASPNSQIACLFGIFQFFGCRKILTTAQVTGWNFPLAPAGTKFDYMWFTQTAPKLVLFDGNLPVHAPPVQILPNDNSSPASIVGDPSETLENKLDIPVLNQAPRSFRLLAPHQDWQFVGDRPFFFMDGKRTFMVTSTGSSGKRPDPPVGWLDGNLATAWRGDYFPRPAPAPQNGNGIVTNPIIGTAALSVLVPGPGGGRMAREMPPLSLEPEFRPRTLFGAFWTTRKYQFTNFHHPFLCAFEKVLDQRGIHALLSLETQSAPATQSFEAIYSPEVRVLEPRPVDEVEFQRGGAYESYNWELFFHIPLLIATRLTTNQRFAEAQRWFHFIFDPAGASGEKPPRPYWRTKPFHDRQKEGYESDSVKKIEEMIAQGHLSPELDVAVKLWRSNPFSPHAIARLRTTAYQKTVVMKYIDNLIAWGDQLFRRDTLESINEATQLYVLAADILGRRPEVIQRNLKAAVETFNSLEPRLKELGNGLEQIEGLVSDAGDSSNAEDHSPTAGLPSNTILYFCVPENGKLLGYWNTVSDRLFKIRHCMNIEGQVRQLPLFEPPIDPALLVRARAAGLSIGEVLNDITVSLPNYRFSVMSQKANELVGEVRNLGAGLLAALEKRDAEALSLLRSGQETRLLEAVREIRVRQIDEAEANIKGLQSSRQMAETRQQFYESREFLSQGEQASRTSLEHSQKIIAGTEALRLLTAFLGKYGTVKLGSPTTAGIEVGDGWAAYSLTALASALDVTSNVLNINSQLTGRMAEYDRRQDDWDLQANLATIELKQIDQQLIAAEIRLAVAEQELRNHEQQIDNARDIDRHLRAKYTNQDLYQWMIGQISGLYFQSYQFAYQLSKRAERCLQHELGLGYGETNFIRFGYWDSLKKGLLAGDHLAHDLKRLEIAYLDGNVREYELAKHVSLVSLAPEQFLKLKEEGKCEFAIPEWLFDLDTPGHYRRRIKMVSVSIPSVTGPYTSVHCKLQLLKSSFRQNTDLASNYDRVSNTDEGVSDDRFIDDRSAMEAIVTSTGQNDSGLFEPTMRDERYLPFEGAGAISTWRLELPKQFKTFDYNTISDVILHLRYTARDGGAPLGTAAAASVTELVGNATARRLFRLFSLRHEFPSEWHRFISSPPSPGDIHTMTVELATARFPYFVQGKEININEAVVVERTRSDTLPQIGVTPGQTAPTLGETAWAGEDPVGEGPGLARHTSTAQGKPGLWTFGTNADPNMVDDVFLIFGYSAT